jgi:hypothetical protein
MVILDKPRKTKSYQSWRDLPYAGDAGVLVQMRTADGLAKNASLAHRLAFTATDLFAFRILLVDGSIKPFPELTNHNGRAAHEASRKLVVAVGETKKEILKDWGRMEKLAVGGAVSVDTAGALLAQLAGRRAHESDSDEAAPTQASVAQKS